jgi:hypothetical protein
MVVTHIPSKFTGIIQLVPEESHLKDIQAAIISRFPEQKRIGKIDKDGNFISKLHVTCLHQAIPKLTSDSNGTRGDKALKAWFKLNSNNIKTPDLELGWVGITTDGDRTSTFIRINNPKDIRAFLANVLAGAGLDNAEVKVLSESDTRELGRIFHISLTNLTGNSGDSVPNIANGANIMEDC